ncbi:2-iminoacetate synthase ThiH [Sphingobacterium lumbrici]|uniref:2-iminoacetate synthase ThiH n=1 Tax=Sphingobacterium lumbrici TaxID=2559600 RepID=UPI00112929F9|nr:2-iminoacetate synthase ThiH [Sphingobacterium lumbrici]
MFHELFQNHNWDAVKSSIYQKTAKDVESALTKNDRSLEDFKAFVSPAAAHYLEEMATLSQAITQKRFGKTIQLYIPLYLSNECQNICTYCAFSMDNKIPRRTLSPGEIYMEAEVIKSMGYEHVLLVTGEASKIVGVEFLEQAIRQLKPHFANISMEVQPLEQEDYQRLIKEGLYAVLVYQETYHQDVYRNYHPKGKKSNFQYRLDTPDRLGRAGIHKIGLGTLIGLEDWRTEAFFTGLHLQYLEQHYWKTKYSLSFPRLRPISTKDAVDGTIETQQFYMKDRELLQLICAYRLFNEQVELSLSTREEPYFRDHVIPLGITSLSAGSKTNPGGYIVEPQALEQFEISDERSAFEMVKVIERQGYEAVWKDWERCYAT